MRRDAQARRESLIRAAAECFLRSGYLVPLEEVAERAGVGRGTLYRNFRDRMALALAIFEREVERIEESLDPSLPLDQAIARLVVGGRGASALFSRLAADMPMDGESRVEFTRLGERIERLLQPAVDRAHREGLLRADIGTHEALMAVRMISGLLKPHTAPAEMEAIIAEALPLLMTGLRPR